MGDLLRSSPMLWILTFAVGGIVAGRYIVGWILVFIIIALVVASILFFKGYRFYGMLVGGAMLCGIASWYVDLNFNRFTAPQGVEELQVSGIVQRVSESDRSTRLLVKLRDNYRGNCYLSVVGSRERFRPGDIVEFTANFRLPIERKDIDGENLMERFFFLNHIGAIATVPGDKIEVTGEDDTLLWLIKRCREKVVNLIACTKLNPEAQGFLSTLLTGDDSMLYEGARLNYASAGVAHILALSGLHVAIIAMILGICLFPLTWLGRYGLRWACVVVLLWCYAVMTGWTPSVLRAVIMFTLVIIARYSGYRYSSLNALCFAAFVIAVISPRSVFGAGYQLTFVATAALILIPRVIELHRGSNNVVWWFKSYVVYTGAAYIGTLLLAIYWFKQAPLLFMATNLPCTLLLPCIMGVGIIVIFLQAIGIQWGLLISVEDFLCRIVDGTVLINSSMPGVLADNVYISALSVVAGYLLLVWVLWSINNHKLRFCAIGLIGIAVILILPILRRPEDTLFVSRTGDATTMVMTQGTQCYILTTALPNEIESEIARIGLSHRDFMNKRGIEGLISLNDRDGKIYEVKFCDKRILVVNGDEFQPIDSVRLDYVIVGNGFKGDILKLVHSMQCDTILLGQDINRRRRFRYLNELREVGKNVRDLGESYGLVLRNN